MKPTNAKRLGAYGALALTAAVAATFAQEPLKPLWPGQGQGQGSDPAPTTGQGRSAQPLTPARPDDPAPAPDLDLDVQIRDSLVATDLDVRERAFDQWADRAAREPGVRAALEAVAADPVDLDLAFTARLALREAGRGVRPGSGQRARAQRLSPFAGGVDPFDEMRKQIEAAFGADPFARDFFADDPFFSGTTPFGPRTGPRFRIGFGSAPGQTGDLQERLEELQRTLDGIQSGQTQPPAGNGAMRFHQSGTSVQITPEGVKVETSEMGENGVERRTYEAKDMDELLELYPELRGRVR